MITKIIDIKDVLKDETNYKVIYFKYGNLNRFTYLTYKSLEYWANRGVNEFKIGMKINVFKVPNTSYYKIVGVVS